MTRSDDKKKKPNLKLLKNLEILQNPYDPEKRSPQIDLKKVNRIRKAIQTGQYQIDFEKMAEKMMKE